jgi:hypothetical protein
MSDDTRHPLATKIHLFRALYRLNRGFETTLTELKRLSELGLDRIDLSEHEVNVELARAELNDELTGLLQSYEQEDEYYWADRRKALERQRADPDDVFFKPRNANRKSNSRSRTFSAASPASIHSGRRPTNPIAPEKSKPPESLNHKGHKGALRKTMLAADLR